MSDAVPHRPHSGPLLLIGAFKLFKATLLLSVGVGALRLLHHDADEQLSGWISEFRIDPHNRYLYAAIQKLGVLDDHKLHLISFGSFFYASLLSIEGVGLCLRKRWAEFFTVGMTTSFVPLEIFELYRRATPIRAVLLIVNLAIVWYLVALLRRDRRAARQDASETGSPESEVSTASAAAPARTKAPRGQSSSHTVR